MNKLHKGPLPPPTTEDSTPFWEFIDTWGGNWMWRNIDTGNKPKDNMQWVADGMTEGTLIWTTDGSYNRKRAADLSGVGWIIFCKATRQQITGSFWERSTTASLFRAKMLCLCALHLLARAIAEYYDLHRWLAMMCWDNKWALLLSSHHKGWIRPSAKCADIRRSFWATKQTCQGGFKCIHVYGHMDQHLLWSQLSITQHLNCVCNTLAKQAVTSAIIEGYRKEQAQFFPREDIALILWGDKVTGDISVPLHFHSSKSVAHKYHLHQQKKGRWTHKQFKEVDWEHLDLAFKSKADNYRIWQSKQTSGSCRTGLQVGLYSREMYPDKQCPNRSARETDAHLMQCSDKDRTRLLIENVEELEKWMEMDGRTDPELIYWILKYILLWNDKPFSQLGYMSQKMCPLVENQDKIWWRDFTKGYISFHFYNIQQFHLSMSSSYLNGSDWTKQFITKILQLTHLQWIYRSISLHDKHQGYLRNKQSEDLLQEIANLSKLSPNKVPDNCRFLL